MIRKAGNFVDELNLKEILQELWSKKFLIIVITFIGRICRVDV